MGAGLDSSGISLDPETAHQYARFQYMERFGVLTDDEYGNLTRNHVRWMLEIGRLVDRARARSEKEAMERARNG